MKYKFINGGRASGKNLKTILHAHFNNKKTILTFSKRNKEALENIIKTFNLNINVSYRKLSRW